MKKQKHHKFQLGGEGELDELFVYGAFVHIERMDDSSFWIGIYPPKSSGLPDIMLNTGVHKGTWYFNVRENCGDDPQDFGVSRPRKAKRKVE